MTSSNGNISRVTGPLCGEFTGTGEFPAQRPVTRSFDVFFGPNNRLSKQPWGWWFETPSWSLWRQCNVPWKNWLSPAPTSQHYPIFTICHWPLRWRHNELDGVSDHQPHDCLLNRLFERRSKKKHQSSASPAFVRGIHRGPMNSPHKWPVACKMFPFDDVIMFTICHWTKLFWAENPMECNKDLCWLRMWDYMKPSLGTNVKFNDDLICAAPLKMADRPWLGTHPVELECFNGKSPGAPLSIRINLNSSRDK